MKQIRISCRGLVLHEDKILLQNIDGRDFWNVPGGGFEHTDASVQDCVEREILEETGMRTEAGRLLFVQELQSNECEQIELFFAMKPIDPAEYSEYCTDSDAPELINRLCWFALADIAEMQIKPSKLQAILGDLLSVNVDIFTSEIKN